MKKRVITLSFVVSISFVFYSVIKLTEIKNTPNMIDKRYNSDLKPSMKINSYEFYNNYYLLDAFYDERIEAVRVFSIGLLKKIPIPELKLVYNDREVSGSVKIAGYNKYTKLYDNYVIYNNLTSEIPKYVKITNHLIPILYYPQDIAKRYDTTICIAIFKDYNSVNHFIQVVESNIHFGVDHIVIYKISCSLEMEKVLKYYQDKGIIDVITMNKTLEFGILKNEYFGHIWKLNDCFYRYRIISKHILILDLDEILWSEQKQSSHDLKLFMNRNNDCSTFYFRQRLYHREILNAFDRYISNLTDADIFSFREYCELKWKRIMKYFIYDTRLVADLEVHFVKSYFSGFKRCYVPIEVGYVRHYRRISYMHLDYCNSSLKMDNFVDNEEKEIRNKVKMVENDINIHPTFNNDIIILGSVNNKI